MLSELQKRADRADQSVLFFLAGANFWEKHAKNCAIMSMAHITYTVTVPLVLITHCFYLALVLEAPVLEDTSTCAPSTGAPSTGAPSTSALALVLLAMCLKG